VKYRDLHISADINDDTHCKPLPDMFVTLLSPPCRYAVSICKGMYEKADNSFLVLSSTMVIQNGNVYVMFQSCSLLSGVFC